MIYLGIDPGHAGGIALVSDTGDAQAMIYADYTLTKVCDAYKNNCKAVVEKVSAKPGQGVTSMFNFGKSFGYILGVLEANGIPYELVPPQKWKREYSVTSDKNTSIEVCKRLFPKINLFRTNRCTKEHDGMAESLLIAEYGRRHCK